MRRALALLLFASFGRAATARADGPDETLLLEVGSPLQRDLANGATHRYRLQVGTGDFVRLTVEQRDVDVVVRVLGENGALLLDMDGPMSDRGREEVAWIADRAGQLGVEVMSEETVRLGGKYEIALVERRPELPQDRQRLEAQALFSEGLRLWRKPNDAAFQFAAAKLTRAGELWHGVGESYLQAMAVYGAGLSISLSDQRQALERFRRARDLWKIQGHTAEEASALTWIAASELLLDETGSALDHYHEALALERLLGNLRHEADVMNGLGRSYEAVGEIQKAREHFATALSLMVATGRVIGQLQTLNRLGGLLEALGEKQKALDYYREALSLARRWEVDRWEPVFLLSLGRLYVDLGETARALEALNESLRFYRGVGRLKAQALVLAQLGRCYARTGDNATALARYGEAQPLLREEGDRRAQASLLTAMSESLTAEGRLDESLAALEEALCLARVTADLTQEGDVLSRLGATWAALGNLQRAHENLLRALPIQEATENRPGRARTFCELARVERAESDLASALTHSEAAVDLAEDLRNEVSSDDLRATFFGTVQQYYALAMDVLADLHAKEPGAGFDARALSMSERERARSLLDLLGETRAEAWKDAEPELAARERSLRRRIAVSLVQPPSAGGPRSKPAPAPKPADIELLRQEHREVLERLRAANPRYAAFTRREPLSLTEIQSQLGPQDLLLEYALGDDRSHLWAVTQTSLTSHELPNRVEVDTAARALYGLLTARNARPDFETKEEERVRVARADEESVEAAARLSHVLLAPVAHELSRKRLLVVADGSLQYIPFAALPRPGSRGAPLVVDHEIVSLPSASALALLRRQLAGREPAPGLLAVLADPVFEKGDRRVRASGSTRRRLVEVTPAAAESPVQRRDLLRSARDVGVGARIQRLPFTRREARAILSLVPPAARKEALDFDASLETATSSGLSQYRFVHFATHGFLNSLHPELTGLVLSLVDRDGRERDGFLSAGDVFNLRLPAELVTLSGCRTGLGREIRGEGLVGLTRAFMYAGAARVLVSLWDVDDLETSELMARFYKGMLTARLTPAAALRRAQVSILRDTRWKAPYYWAAFTLQGEPN